MPGLSTPSISFVRENYKKKQLVKFYRKMLYPRLVEEKMLKYLRQGKISKWFSGIGQESIPVGATLAMNEDEYIFPMHRNMGVFLTRGIPLNKLFAQWQGKVEGFTKGRDRSFHFGAPEYKISGMISHLATQTSVAAGTALAYKLKKEQKVALAFIGDGATSEGEFHEALNMAAVWDLPVIFLIEHNGYGLSTPNSEQFRCKRLVDKAIGYGMEGVTIDGNNVLEVYDTVSKYAKAIRKDPKPIIIECMTFRMRGHEEASGNKYVPKELLDHWAQKDPVHNFEKFLLEEEILSEDDVLNIREKISEDIEKELALAESFQDPVPGNEEMDLFRSSPFIDRQGEGIQKEMRLIDAISNALEQSMETHDDLIIMGQDIAEYGGVFKITNGFIDKFGRERVRNTPIIESAVLGMAVGLSVHGMKSVVEMQFSDFVTCGFNQIVNNIAKLHYRWGQNVNTVIRMPTGGTVGAGPFHSQSTEAWFTHTPGLKVVYPSNPLDAKGLLISSIADPNPVMFFEHKALYRSSKALVYENQYTIEIGKARVHREGEDLSIITYGIGVHWAEKAVNEMGINAEIIDLRTLIPMDYEAIEETVKKTNKVLLLHEDIEFGGIASDLSAYIADSLFEYLDAPILRCTSRNTPVPFSKILENDYMADVRLKDQIQKLLDY